MKLLIFIWGYPCRFKSDFHKADCPISGQDNFTVQNNYSFDDMNVSPNVVYYYRLRQVDNNGAFEYTDILSARLTGEISFSVAEFVPSPTVANPNLAITGTKEQDITVTFHNILGQKVLEGHYGVNKGANRIEFDLGQLASGTFTAIVSSANEVYTRNVVLTK